jgi:hypothetical protein
MCAALQWLVILAHPLTPADREAAARRDRLQQKNLVACHPQGNKFFSWRDTK